MIEKMILEIINEVLGMPKNSVTATSTKEVLGMDSLDDIEVIMMLEEKFEIEIADEVAESFTTVQSIIDYIGQQESEKTFNQKEFSDSEFDIGN